MGQQKLRKVEQLDEQPYVAEMTLIEQTMLFCKSLTQSKGTDQKEEKKDTVHDNPEGTQVLLKKEDRDEYYFTPTAKGKKGKSKHKSDGGSAGSKPIKHNAETFRLFEQLKLDAPITTGDIPATLEKLEEQLEDYKQKIKDWEETREEKKRKILEGLEALSEVEKAKKKEEDDAKKAEEKKDDDKEEDDDDEEEEDKTESEEM